MRIIWLVQSHVILHFPHSQAISDRVHNSL
jgi:hypothetical protein